MTKPLNRRGTQVKAFLELCGGSDSNALWTINTVSTTMLEGKIYDLSFNGVWIQHANGDVSLCHFDDVTSVVLVQTFSE